MRATKETKIAEIAVFLIYSLSQFVIVNKTAKAVLKSPSQTTNKTIIPKALFKLAPKNTIGISYKEASGHKNNKKVMIVKLKNSKKLPSNPPKKSSFFVWDVPIFEKIKPEKNMFEQTKSMAYNNPPKPSFMVLFSGLIIVPTLVVFIAKIIPTHNKRSGTITPLVFVTPEKPKHTTIAAIIAVATDAMRYGKFETTEKSKLSAPANIELKINTLETHNTSSLIKENFLYKTKFVFWTVVILNFCPKEKNKKDAKKNMSAVKKILKKLSLPHFAK